MSPRPLTRAIAAAPSRARIPAVLTSLLLVACSGDPGATAGAVPAATAACGPVEFPALQFGSHLIGDAEPPVPYSSTPPTSGWHTSGSPAFGIASRPLTDPEQVAVLEVGGVVVTHRGLTEAELDSIVELIDEPDGDLLAVTEYPRGETGHVTFTSWGAVQRCDGVDVDALRAYVTAYAGESSETAAD